MQRKSKRQANRHSFLFVQLLIGECLKFVELVHTFSQTGNADIRIEVAKAGKGGHLYACLRILVIRIIAQDGTLDVEL